MKLIYKKSFVKRYQKLTKSLQHKTDKTIKQFTQDPTHSTLNNHKLHGKRQSCRSINITGDLRIIIRDTGKERYEVVEIITLGTHSQLYD